MICFACFIIYISTSKKIAFLLLILEIKVRGLAQSVIEFFKHNKVMTAHHLVLPMFYFPLIVVCLKFKISHNTYAIQLTKTLRMLDGICMMAMKSLLKEKKLQLAKW